ncbi:MAG: hypothetical protein RBG13Loki_2499 [Promethearchaeota archaeon CR_4]|nr:MAG: hypothetical protein RBG13Loki_2499 [Candidatus Lokiarchaeota archaeon CR_4]
MGNLDVSHGAIDYLRSEWFHNVFEDGRTIYWGYYGKSESKVLGKVLGYFSSKQREYAKRIHVFAFFVKKDHAIRVPV